MQQLKWLAAAAACVSLATLPAPAQEPADVVVHKEVRVAPGQPGPNLFYFRSDAAPGPFTMDFVGAEMSIGGAPIKGAPYSADAVTETVQTLSDGNRITRKTTSTIYRDSQGRTRREETMNGLGPWPSGEPVKSIFIQDPVAGVRYNLNPQTHVAHKLPVGKVMFDAGAHGGSGGQHEVRVLQRSVVADPAAAAGAEASGKSVEITVENRGSVNAMHPDVKTESLGKRTIEGVEAEGKRSTVTLPAGAIGNEMPIASVSERWYSADLQTVVMSKHSDPRFGDTTYQLTNVQRGEQALSLFEVPADYTVKDEGSINDKLMQERMMRLQHTVPQDK